MSDWADFCDALGIDANDPDQFDELLDQWSREEAREAERGMPMSRALLLRKANPYCERCGGTGYIGRYKHVEQGRCFKCFPG